MSGICSKHQGHDEDCSICTLKFHEPPTMSTPQNELENGKLGINITNPKFLISIKCPCGREYGEELEPFIQDKIEKAVQSNNLSWIEWAKGLMRPNHIPPYPSLSANGWNDRNDEITSAIEARLREIDNGEN